MDKGALLDRLGAAGEERLALSRVLDRYEPVSYTHLRAHET